MFEKQYVFLNWFIHYFGIYIKKFIDYSNLLRILHYFFFNIIDGHILFCLIECRETFNIDWLIRFTWLFKRYWYNFAIKFIRIILIRLVLITSILNLHYWRLCRRRFYKYIQFKRYINILRTFLLRILLFSIVCGYKFQERV